MVKIALIQMSASNDAEATTAKAIAQVKEAAKHGAELVCLPELFQHPYFPVVQKTDDSAYALAETIDGPTIQRLAHVARDAGVWLVAGSIYEREGEGSSARYYNTAPIFSPDGALVSAYRKCHIPQDPGFYEKEYFEEGTCLPPVVETPFGKICAMICFDQWFPEAARAAVLKGAQILIYPTAIGMPEGVENITGDWREMWQTAQRGHAAANNVYVAAINRIGREVTPQGEASEFFGGSFVADFAGKKISESDVAEEIIYAECDLVRQIEVQEAWCFLANRRSDLYGGLAKVS
jgi:predicted amidohydrolase